jgi:uncharacterized protein (TIGR02246 family)
MRGLVLAWLLAACACGAGAAHFELEVGRLLHDQSAAWNRGDLEAFCAVYAEDATFVSPSGLTTGRQAVLDRYRKKYVDKEGMGSLTLDVKEMRAQPPAGASVVARWTLTWPDKPKAQGLTLLVLTRTPDGWRIVQDASM